MRSRIAHGWEPRCASISPWATSWCMSNGIADAIDADGQLFGFERVLELVRSAYSVADVVAEAQRFGQEETTSASSPLLALRCWKLPLHKLRRRDQSAVVERFHCLEPQSRLLLENVRFW